MVMKNAQSKVRNQKAARLWFRVES